MAKFNHLVQHVNGRHPVYGHLVYFEVDQDHGMFVLTTPAKPGDCLVSWEEWQDMVGNVKQAEMEFAYLMGDYLAMLRVRHVEDIDDDDDDDDY